MATHCLPVQRMTDIVVSSTSAPHSNWRDGLDSAVVEDQNGTSSCQCVVLLLYALLDDPQLWPVGSDVFWWGNLYILT